MTGITAKGIVGTRVGKGIPFASVILTDANGVPVIFNGKRIGTITDDDGKFELDIPSQSSDNGNVPVGSHLLVRSMEYDDQLMILSSDQSTYDFILGEGALQEFGDIVVTAPKKPDYPKSDCNTLKCKTQRLFADNKNKVIAGVIALVTLSLIITIVAVTHSPNKK